MNRPRLALVLTVAACVAAIAGPAAHAHLDVVATSPKAGAKVTKATRVTVTFSAVVRSGTISVRAADGRLVSTPAGGRDPANARRLRVGLLPGLASGSYTVRWTVRGADGHRQSGRFRFAIR
jgi:methionine-rich copper-binding protein CopC